MILTEVRNAKFGHSTQSIYLVYFQKKFRKNYNM